MTGIGGLKRLLPHPSMRTNQPEALLHVPWGAELVDMQLRALRVTPSHSASQPRNILSLSPNDSFSEYSKFLITDVSKTSKTEPIMAKQRWRLRHSCPPSCFRRPPLETPRSQIRAVPGDPLENSISHGSCPPRVIWTIISKSRSPSYSAKSH